MWSSFGEPVQDHGSRQFLNAGFPQVPSTEHSPGTARLHTSVPGSQPLYSNSLPSTGPPVQQQPLTAWLNVPTALPPSRVSQESGYVEHSNSQEVRTGDVSKSPIDSQASPSFGDLASSIISRGFQAFQAVSPFETRPESPHTERPPGVSGEAAIRTPRGDAPFRTCSFGTSISARWPPQILDHMRNSPDGTGRRYKSRSGNNPTPATSGLRLVSGACQIPHPLKAEAGGEDSYFISADGCGCGVADGVGEWEKLAVTTKVFADELMACTSAAMDDLVRCGVGSEQIGQKAQLSLRRGYASISRSYGACTASVAMLDRYAGLLGIANVGDSGARQIRKGTEVQAPSWVVSATAEKQHSFNCPFQLSRRPYEVDIPVLLSQGKWKLAEAVQNGVANRIISDSPDDADIYTFQLQEGDLLVFGSDGLFDNLHETEICDFMDLAVSPLEARQAYAEHPGILRGPGSSTDPGALATSIAHAAFHRASDPSASTPFSQNAQAEGVPHIGGKMDDITVVCAWVVKVARAT